MAESLLVASGSKEEKYQALLPQILALVQHETDATANQANVVAALRETFGFFWVGFYVVKNNDLVLGPFQGPVACTRIGFGRGVCGACWQSQQTMVVPNVDEFPGHIACSAASKSEIVTPFFNSQGAVAAVLDIDSDRLADFDEVDRMYLERLEKSIRQYVC
jgi:GAF domain-containing protein